MNKEKEIFDYCIVDGKNCWVYKQVKNGKFKIIDIKNGICNNCFNNKNNLLFKKK